MDILNPGDQISSSITVRGAGMTEQAAMPMATPKLNDWQVAQLPRLPDGHHFQSEDTFSTKPQGEHSVKRTLTVVEDDPQRQDDDD